MQKFVTHNLYGMNEYGAAVTAVLPVNDPKYVYLASDVDALKGAIEVAIVELEAVEREIGIPSKALPLLRAGMGKEVKP